MGYLAIQILLFLILSVLLGFAIGWWLKTAYFRTTTSSEAFLSNGLRTQLADVQREREAEQSVTGRLREELAVARREGTSFKNEAAQLRVAVIDAQQDDVGQQTEIDRLREALAAAQAQSNDTAAVELRTQLAASQRECQSCLEEVEALRAQVAALGGGAQQPELLANPVTPPDDLKMISGVGSKLERTLNDLGIYYFKQIAGFTPGNVAWVDERLRFKGRIQRERWIEQARKLAAGEQTEFSRRHKNT